MQSFQEMCDTINGAESGLQWSHNIIQSCVSVLRGGEGWRSYGKDHVKQFI